MFTVPLTLFVFAPCSAVVAVAAAVVVLGTADAATHISYRTYRPRHGERAISLEGTSPNRPACDWSWAHDERSGHL